MSVGTETINSQLRREPTKVELSESNNIRAMIWHITNELHRIGISDSAIENYQLRGFDFVLRAHIEHGLNQYSLELSNQLYDEARKNHEDYKTRTYACKHQIMRKTVSLLEEYYHTGTIEWKYLRPYKLRRLCGEYSRLLDNYCTEAIRIGTIKESYLTSVKGAIRSFLFELEDASIFTFKAVTLRTVSERVTHMSQRYSGGLSTALHKIRAFLKYLYSNGTTKLDLSVAIPEFVAGHRKIRPGFSNEEIESLLSAVDRATPLGKRDYAIMTLAAQTGLRACDVADLKRQNINWRLNELRMVQRKTGRALTLPLPIECGNAIAEYLLTARPECNEPYVFLCERQPFRKIQSKSIANIVSRYVTKANLAGAAIKPHAFHGFRRSYGKRLLEAGTSLDMLSELLGHEDMDSAKPYIAVDENGLKFCALSLVALEKGSDIE